MEDDLPKVQTDESDESNEEQGDEVYIVEAILDKRKIKKKAEYLIKWKGYDNPADNTWEPEENCQCPDLIEAFEKMYKEKHAIAGSSKTPLGANAKKRKLTETISATPVSSASKSGKQKEDSAGNATKQPGKKNKSKETVDHSSDEEPDEPIPKGLEVKTDASLAEPGVGKTYDVERGKSVISVLGVKKSDKCPGLVALVRYVDNSYELVPTSVLCVHASKQIVSFYESRLRFF
ncbi:chromo (CHRromatin organization MOdifier) domain-containing protein [Ditylenchus destructor]|nr:chromo (CHRromatin organization MOdifier) domain-containing protein [Ditylenchus destructor]